MNVRIVIPARAPELGKTRLAAALSPSQRAALGWHMLRHVLQVAAGAVGPSAVHVISRSVGVLAEAEALGLRTITERGEGLNAALEQARARLVREGSGPILTLSADLPLLTAEDLVALLATPGDVVCATDVPRDGTNALLQRRPGHIPYCYGPDSLTAHRAAALDRGLDFAVVHRPGLAQDVDTPADLADMAPDWATHPSTDRTSRERQLPMTNSNPGNSHHRAPAFVERHREMYLRSGGTEGHILDLTELGGSLLPTLLLRTTGRKSGKISTQPLIYGVYGGPNGGEWVVIASKGGAPAHPGWYHNMKDQPEVLFQVATQCFRASYREAEGEERDRVWDFMCRLYPPYADYKVRAGERVIPIILMKPLEPAPILTTD